MLKHKDTTDLIQSVFTYGKWNIRYVNKHVIENHLNQPLPLVVKGYLLTFLNFCLFFIP